MVERCQAAGSSRLYIDQPFFDDVCRAFEVDLRKGQRGIKLLGVSIRAFGLIKPGAEEQQARAQQQQAMRNAAVFGMGVTGGLGGMGGIFRGL